MRKKFTRQQQSQFEHHLCANMVIPAWIGLLPSRSHNKDVASLSQTWLWTPNLPLHLFLPPKGVPHFERSHLKSLVTVKSVGPQGRSMDVHCVQICAKSYGSLLSALWARQIGSVSSALAQVRGSVRSALWIFGGVNSMDLGGQLHGFVHGLVSSVGP